MSIKDYEGGIITKNPTTPTGPFQDGAASGVWTMDQAAEYTKQGVWPIAGNVPSYVDDVFSSYLYEGASTPQTITNGIDLSGEGGMVWIKCRDNAYDNFVFDTERTNKHLHTNKTDQEIYDSSNYIDYNSDGFDVEASSGLIGGPYSFNYASWSFRKQAGFFDVVTYTGTGTTRTVSHNLGSTPAVIIIKRLDAAVGWPTYHEANGNTGLMYLNTTAAKVTSTTAWGSTSPTDTEFTVGTNVNNISGGQFVAYLFASDDQSFGDNGDESIIKCGSFTHNYSGTTVNLGWEPQWILVKAADQAVNWYIFDVMRGIVTGGVSGDGDAALFPNTSGAENVNTWGIDVNATGFTVYGNNILSSGDAIYIAIRRPMKTPEAGTDVFKPVTYTGTGAAASIDSGFPVDLYIGQRRTPANVYFNFRDRLRGKNQTLQLPSTSAEFSNTSLVCNFDDMDGVNYTGINLDTTPNASGESDLVWMFKRATGFMDVVAYTGNGSPSNTVRRDLNHNLGVTPELAILKRRDTTSEWQVGANGTSLYLNLSNGSAGTYTHSSYFNATDFDVEGWVTEANNNVSGSDYIVYLFATLAGISKVGSYTGTAANLDVDCGFTSGARFILIKRTDSTGDWYVYDSERGIVAGNDPYLLLNSTAVEVTGTDYIDPLSSGFTVTSSAPAGLNASGGTYIFLAIA